MASSKKTTVPAEIITLDSYVNGCIRVLTRLLHGDNFNPTGRYVALSTALGDKRITGKSRAVKLTELLAYASQTFAFLSTVWVSLDISDRSRVTTYSAMTADTAFSIQSRALYHYTEYVLCNEVTKASLGLAEMRKAFRMAVLEKGLRFLPSFKDFSKELGDVTQELVHHDEFLHMQELLSAQQTPTGIRLIGYVKGFDAAADINAQLTLLMAEFEKRFLKRFEVIDIDKEVKLALKVVNKSS